MRYILQPDNTAAAIEAAMLNARENGEPAVIGRVPNAVRLVCFDLDGTLIRMETINALAEDVGIGENMSTLTSMAMCGEEDFEKNFRRRVKMLAGVPVSSLYHIASEMPCAYGLENLMHQLQARNVQTAIITGNFNMFGQALKEKFGFDYIFTTFPEMENAYLTGEICGEIIDAQAKTSIMENLCAEIGVPLENTIAVGDGANDIPMLLSAETAVVYNAITASVGIDEVVLPLLDNKICTVCR